MCHVWAGVLSAQCLSSGSWTDQNWQRPTEELLHVCTQKLQLTASWTLTWIYDPNTRKEWVCSLDVPKNTNGQLKQTGQLQHYSALWGWLSCLSWAGSTCLKSFQSFLWLKVWCIFFFIFFFLKKKCEGKGSQIVGRWHQSQRWGW